MRRSLASCTVAGAAVIASLWLGAGAAFAAGSSPAAAPATTTSAPSSAIATSTTPTTPAPTTPPPPAAPAVVAHAHLTLAGAFDIHRDAVTVPGRGVEVQGVVRPYVAGQWVQVQTFLGARLIRTDRLRVKPDGGGQARGAFTEWVHSPAAGMVRIEVVHARTPQMQGFFAERVVAALNPSAGPGARGLLVDLVQQRLAALHLYMPQSGVFDQQTALALDAYHRLLGWGEGNQSLDARTVGALLDGRGSFVVRYPRDGAHVEGDLGDQLLALIDGSRVYRIYPISSGKPSTPTVLGHFQVYYRVPGYLPDGMYFSSFFYRGYAIHGYDPAPDYPASHGCMRLPISDALSVFHWIRYGDWVDVYQ